MRNFEGNWQRPELERCRWRSAFVQRLLKKCASSCSRFARNIDVLSTNNARICLLHVKNASGNTQKNAKDCAHMCRNCAEKYASARTKSSASTSATKQNLTNCSRTVYQ